MTEDLQKNQNRDEKNFYNFLEEKISKLSTAVYMVTTYMHDDEPLKKNLRIVSLETLSHSGHLSKKHEITRIEDLLRDIRHLIHLINLSDTIGVMSHMNANILKDEYLKIEDVLLSKNISTTLLPHHVYHDSEDEFLNSQSETSRTINFLKNSKISEYPILQESLNDKTISREDLLSKNDSQKNKEDSKKNNVEYIKNSTQQKPQDKSLQKAGDSIKDKLSKIKEKKHAEKNERKNKRKEEIMSLLSYTNEKSIKDIVEAISGCSEKTVQRELNDLVESELVIRTGEKRWSRYMLA